MADIDLEKVRKGLAAALDALGPSKAPDAAPQHDANAGQGAPAPQAAAAQLAAPKTRTIKQSKEGSPLCFDCDTEEPLIVANADNPDELIRAMNSRHKHGNALNCPTCRPAIVEALQEGEDGYDVKQDSGPNGELRLIPKKK